MKIKLARDQAEFTIMEQRRIQRQKDFMAEQKRIQFEAQRDKVRNESLAKSKAKEENLKKIFQDALMIEELKKEKMIKAREDGELRQQILAEE